MTGDPRKLKTERNLVLKAKNIDLSGFEDGGWIQY
jgi:hypothetical protein